MPSVDFSEHIVRTLLYYEIFDHPLTGDELFYLSPKNSVTKSAFLQILTTLTEQGSLACTHGYYSLPSGITNGVQIRSEREQMAARRMRMAHLMTHVIKRFPFVRGVFLSGDLSKGVAHRDSDIDYVIVTKSHRLWICRTFLMLFKKIFLLNSKKYFCLNYYVAEDNLRLDDQNYFTATEIAHLKPLYNIGMFIRYINANVWIKRYFPNYRAFALTYNEANSRRSFVQALLEFPLMGRWVTKLDKRLMIMMKRVWEKRYPQYDATTREKIFRCTPTESCAYVGNFSDRILALYGDKLDHHNLKL